jgi:hypothetical protein
MDAIEADPKVLEAVATASAHAADQAITHIDEEIKARDVTKLEPLLGSLAASGPYAYTIMPQITDGSVRLPVLTTFDEIHEAYKFIRGMSALHEVIGLTEVRGSWYLFQDSMTRGGPHQSDVINDRQTLGLFPSGVGEGITGELVWLRIPRAQLGAADEVDVFADADELHARKQVYDQYERFLDGLRANDVDAIADTLHDGVASAVRDYVGATGTLVELQGIAAHRDWYRALFAKYEVRGVQRLYQVTDDWYVFAELRVTVTARADGRTFAFHTAEFHVPAKNGRFIARIGHGTEPA